MDENEKITYFAITDARTRRVPFGIKAKDRTKHVYVIGKTGMGKSTLLENMAIQDIQNGEGLAFIDPHGKTADLLLDYVPEHRIKDVLYFAPFDLEHPIAFNVMEDVGPDKRFLVVAGLMSAFKKIWVDAWSARMEYILQNTLFALLEYPDSTLLDINKMLVDKEFRKRVVSHITDPTVKSFWVDEFAKYTDRYTAEATPAIQNKVGQFTSNGLIRNIVGQPKSSFNIRKMMDEKKILIINLSKGLVGEGNANLLGSMLVTKIYLSAMSRADVPESTLRTLPNFYLYVDEFQSFANESFADILSEARKYKLNLTIAHQYIEQMEEEVRDAVFGNVGTMIAFRVGAFDAEVLEKEFAPQFTAEDLVNLGFTQVYLKLMIDGVSSLPFSALTMPPIEKMKTTFRDSVIASSRMLFAKPREKVEREILEHTFYQDGSAPKEASPRTFTEDRAVGGGKNFQHSYIDKVLDKSKEAVKPKPEALRSTLMSVLTGEEEKKPALESKEKNIQGGGLAGGEGKMNILNIPNIPRKPFKENFGYNSSEKQKPPSVHRPDRVFIKDSEKRNFEMKSSGPPSPPSNKPPQPKSDEDSGKQGLKDALAFLIKKEQGGKIDQNQGVFNQNKETGGGTPSLQEKKDLPLEKKNQQNFSNQKDKSALAEIPESDLRRMLDVEE